MKIKILFLGFFVFICSMAYSQNQLLFYASGDASKIISNEWDNTQYEGNYYSRISNWKVGLESHFRVFKKLQVTTGLKYKNLGAISPEFVFGSGIDPVTGVKFSTRIKDNYSFLEVPLGICYTIREGGYYSKNQNTFSWNVCTGVGLNYLLNYKNQEISSNGNKETINKSNGEINAKTFHFSFNLAVSMDYAITNNLGVFVRPNIDYHFSNLYKENTTKKYFKSLGIAFGLRKDFGWLVKKRKNPHHINF